MYIQYFSPNSCQPDISLINYFLQISGETETGQIQSYLTDHCKGRYRRHCKSMTTARTWLWPSVLFTWTQIFFCLGQGPVPATSLYMLLVRFLHDGWIYLAATFNTHFCFFLCTCTHTGLTWAISLLVRAVDEKETFVLVGLLYVNITVKYMR